MREQEIVGLVDANLEHIPRGTHGSPQNLLRASYLTIRKRDLDEAPMRTRKESLAEAIHLVRQVAPDFRPEFDETYFSPPRIDGYGARPDSGAAANQPARNDRSTDRRPHPGATRSG